MPDLEPTPLPDAAAREAVPPDPSPGTTAAGPPRRLLHDFLRPSWAQVLLAIAVFLVSMSAVLAARIRTADSDYSTLRRADLVQLLDTLDSQQGRLQGQVNALDATLTQLTTGADAARVAAEANQRRLDTLQVLAGTVATRGPGVQLTIVDPQLKVTPEMLVECVQELRDAGAEAIEVDHQVRVVASTWFDADGTQLVADGVVLQRPIVIVAIGDPDTLVGALQFRGGVVATVQSQAVGGTALVARRPTVTISSLHHSTPLRFARPR